MSPSSLKKMSGISGYKEGNYASSDLLRPRNSISSSDLGLTLLPGSQTQKTDNVVSKIAGGNATHAPRIKDPARLLIRQTSPHRAEYGTVLPRDGIRIGEPDLSSKIKVNSQSSSIDIRASAKVSDSRSEDVGNPPGKNTPRARDQISIPTSNHIDQNVGSTGENGENETTRSQGQKRKRIGRHEPSERTNPTSSSEGPVDAIAINQKASCTNFLPGTDSNDGALLDNAEIVSSTAVASPLDRKVCQARDNFSSSHYLPNETPVSWRTPSLFDRTHQTSSHLVDLDEQNLSATKTVSNTLLEKGRLDNPTTSINDWSRHPSSVFHQHSLQVPHTCQESISDTHKHLRHYGNVKRSWTSFFPKASARKRVNRFAKTPSTVSLATISPVLLSSDEQKYFTDDIPSNSKTAGDDRVKNKTGLDQSSSLALRINTSLSPEEDRVDPDDYSSRKYLNNPLTAYGKHPFRKRATSLPKLHRVMSSSSMNPSSSFIPYTYSTPHQEQRAMNSHPSNFTSPIDGGPSYAFDAHGLLTTANTHIHADQSPHNDSETYQGIVHYGGGIITPSPSPDHPGNRQEHMNHQQLPPEPGPSNKGHLTDASLNSGHGPMEWKPSYSFDEVQNLVHAQFIFWESQLQNTTAAAQQQILAEQAQVQNLQREKAHQLEQYQRAVQKFHGEMITAKRRLHYYEVNQIAQRYSSMQSTLAQLKQQLHNAQYEMTKLRKINEQQSMTIKNVQHDNTKLRKVNDLHLSKIKALSPEERPHKVVARDILQTLSRQSVIRSPSVSKGNEGYPSNLPNAYLSVAHTPQLNPTGPFQQDHATQGPSLHQNHISATVPFQGNPHVSLSFGEQGHHHGETPANEFPTLPSTVPVNTANLDSQATLDGSAQPAFLHENNSRVDEGTIPSPRVTIDLTDEASLSSSVSPNISAPIGAGLPSEGSDLPSENSQDGRADADWVNGFKQKDLTWLKGHRPGSNDTVGLTSSVHSESEHAASKGKYAPRRDSVMARTVSKKSVPLTEAQLEQLQQEKLRQQKENKKASQKKYRAKKKAEVESGISSGHGSKTFAGVSKPSKNARRSNKLQKRQNRAQQSREDAQCGESPKLPSAFGAGQPSGTEDSSLFGDEDSDGSDEDSVMEDSSPGAEGISDDELAARLEAEMMAEMAGEGTSDDELAARLEAEMMAEMEAGEMGDSQQPDAVAGGIEDASAAQAQTEIAPIYVVDDDESEESEEE